MDTIKTLVFFVIIYFVYTHWFGEESGCDKYASKYSCSYVEKKATYDVYYWHRVYDGNPDDEKYIGSVIGIRECLSLAQSYAYRIHEPWNDRSYICMLKKDGMNMEKHRLIN